MCVRARSNQRAWGEARECVTVGEQIDIDRMVNKNGLIDRERGERKIYKCDRKRALTVNMCQVKVEKCDTNTSPTIFRIYAVIIYP